VDSCFGVEENKGVVPAAKAAAPANLKKLRLEFIIRI
jgi:hypothetical protein